MSNKLDRCRAVGSLWVAVCLGVAGPAFASARLDCELTYGGDTQRVTAQPVTDPYTVPSVDVAGRFLFKPVLVGAGANVSHVSLYVYVDTERQPVLIQQATYRPPFAASAQSGPIALTGRQHLYAGPVERELIYSCHLTGVAS